jgi:4a-hydroxytetrahydrobiopterin dehydratase
LTTDFKKKDWKAVKRRALLATEIVAKLALLDGWKLDGDGPSVAIEKSFHFNDYFETMAFVNGVALVAHRQDHHPDMSVRYNCCTVRFNTHDVAGISSTDFDCATLIDALLV